MSPVAQDMSAHAAERVEAVVRELVLGGVATDRISLAYQPSRQAQIILVDGEKVWCGWWEWNEEAGGWREERVDD